MRSSPACRPHRPRPPRGRRPASAAGKALRPACSTVSILQPHAGVARGIQHHDVGVSAGLQRADPVGDRQRLGIAARHLPERGERIELLAVAARSPCSPRPWCAASNSWCRRRHRWPPRCAAAFRACGSAGSRTGPSRGTGSRSGRTPPTEPLSDSASRLALRQMDAVAEQRLLRRAARSARRRRYSPSTTDRAPAVKAISAWFSDRCVCMCRSGCSRISAPAISICSGDEVMAKRGVTA